MTRPLKGQMALWHAWKAQEYAIRAAEHGTLLERFARWLEANPHLTDLAAGVARELMRRGHRTGSIGYVWDILLWEHGAKAPSETHAHDPETPRVVALNHDFRAPMARRLQELYPDLRGFFRTRRSQADERRIA